jgi:methionyl aminopeptidase
MINNQVVSYGQMIALHDDRWLARQRIAGKVAAGCIDLLVGLVEDKAKVSMIEMNRLGEEYIVANGCTPTFKNYQSSVADVPFPNGICISVNDELVHGIAKDYVLQEGDLVSFDLGTTFEGAIADTATTVIYGKAKTEEHYMLVDATKRALKLAIKAIKVGKHLGVIGEAIYDYGNGCGYSVVEKYGGHGITYDRAHYFPFVSNRAKHDEGIIMRPGMVLAVEPLFVIGKSNETKVADDKWTVVCDNICAHEEHSLYIHDDHVEVITAREKE